MYIIVGIIFIIIGLVMLIDPEIVFQLTESWKGFSNEPSTLYSISTRIGGACLIIIGIASIIASLSGLI